MAQAVSQRPSVGKSQILTPAPAPLPVFWVDPERLSGTPCFFGTRVPLRHLWDYLENGETLDDFLEGFPGVTREQAVKALELGLTHLLAELSTP